MRWITITPYHGFFRKDGNVTRFEIRTKTTRAGQTRVKHNVQHWIFHFIDTIVICFQLHTDQIGRHFGYGESNGRRCGGSVRRIGSPIRKGRTVHGNQICGRFLGKRTLRIVQYRNHGRFVRNRGGRLDLYDQDVSLLLLCIIRGGR